MDAAMAALDAGEPQVSMAQLEPCRSQTCWGKVDELWGLARDAHVYAERERAGELFLRARAETDVGMRVQTLVAVRQQLSDLISTFPDSRYAPAIRRNVRLVEREIEALGGADQIR